MKDALLKAKQNRWKYGFTFNVPSLSLQLSADPGVSAFPDGDNLFKWIGTIEGGKGTVSL